VFVRSRVRVSNANDWLGLKLKSSEGEGREMTCAVLLKEIFLFFFKGRMAGREKRDNGQGFVPTDISLPK